MTNQPSATASGMLETELNELDRLIDSLSMQNTKLSGVCDKVFGTDPPKESDEEQNPITGGSLAALRRRVIAMEGLIDGLGAKIDRLSCL